jgi:hypothetical protein
MMSLAIDVDHVREVLLSDGEWHRVADGSFELDSYEYVRAADGPKAAPRLGGGQEKLVPATGARWTEREDTSGNQREMFCPLTAIQAVAYGWVFRSSGKRAN